MHDPQIVAHKIKSPFWTHKPWRHLIKHEWKSLPKAWQDLTVEQRAGCLLHFPDGYRETLITVWHVDPESDGSDDSCGWSRPRLNKEQRQAIKNLAWAEAHDPIFLGMKEKINNDIVSLDILSRSALFHVAGVLHIDLSLEDVYKLTARLCFNPCDNLRSSFCLLPGYHTHAATGTKEYMEEWHRDVAESFFACLAGHILSHKRKWWQHPRWHIHHWRLQIHLWQDLRRWLFTRCAGCGKRFKYGSAVFSGQWDSHPPRFMRGEEYVYHQDCFPKPNTKLEVPDAS